MKITPLETFSPYLTKGKQYEVLNETAHNYVIQDDQGFVTGWAKTRFESVVPHLEVFGWELETVKAN